MSMIAVLNKFSIEAIRDALEKLNSFDNLVVNGLNAFQLNEIEKIDPELFAEVAKKIKAEKWFPFAGMWCEADGEISDENLARNALYSADYFRKKFGGVSRIFTADRIYSNAFAQIVFGAKYDSCYVRSEKESYWLDSADGTRTHIAGEIETVDVTEIDGDFIKSNEFTSFEEEIISKFSLPMELRETELPYKKSELTEDEKLLLEAEKIAVQNGEKSEEKIRELWFEIFLGNSVKDEAEKLINGRKSDSDFVKINSDTVELIAVKFAEDGSGDVVIRIKETAGKEQSLFIMCDSIDAGFRTEINPYETLTFRVIEDGFVKEIFIAE